MVAVYSLYESPVPLLSLEATLLQLSQIEDEILHDVIVRYQEQGNSLETLEYLTTFVEQATAIQTVGLVLWVSDSYKAITLHHTAILWYYYFESLEKAEKKSNYDANLVAVPHRLLRRALVLCSSAARLSILDTLCVFMENFPAETQEKESLIERLDICEETFRLSSPDHELYGRSVLHLAEIHFKMFTHNSDLSHIHKAVDLDREWLSKNSESTKLRARTLNQLANCLSMLYTEAKDVEAHLECIHAHRDALDIMEQHDYAIWMGLNNLARILTVEYHRTGDINALEESIRVDQRLIALNGNDHARGEALLGLSDSLMMHFMDTQDQRSLALVYENLKEALDVYPDGHEQRPLVLSKVASQCSLTYRITHEPVWLFMSAAHENEALQLLKEGEDFSERARVGSNYAVALRNLWEHTGNVEFLAEGYQVWQDAFEAEQHAAPEQRSSRMLINYSIFLDSNARKLQQIGISESEWMAKSDATYAALAEILSPDDPDWVSMHAIQAKRHIVSKELPTWDPLKAARHVALMVSENTMQTHRWIGIVELIASIHTYVPDFDASRRNALKESLLQTCEQFIGQLTRLATLSETLQFRMMYLAQAADTLLYSGAYAIDLRGAERALELQESARGVFWSQALQLRSPDIELLPPTIRSELEDCCMQLEQGSFDEQPSWQNNQSTHKRLLEKRLDELVKSVRLLPGLDRFFLGPSFDSLRNTAASGHVVVLLPGIHDSRAIVLEASTLRVITVELTKASDSVTQKWKSEIADCLGGNLRGTINSDNSGTNNDSGSSTANSTSRLGIRRMLPRKSQAMLKVLAEIWFSITLPILRALCMDPDSPPSVMSRKRVHWVPVGSFAFLPIHAAGSTIKLSGAVSISDFFVSSYTPTLSALLHSRTQRVLLPLKEAKALVIAAETAPNLPALPMVRDEIKHVVKTLRVHDTVKLENATVDAVMEQLPPANIVHFACHGTQHNKNPLLSSFHLRDGSLSVTSLMRLRLPQAFLAFLSACETAKGHEEQPDQVLHLAATLLFAGFPSVVATMWAIRDTDGPTIAHAFYQELMKEDVITADAIPLALDMAVRHLREQGAAPEQWAPFVHYGA